MDLAGFSASSCLAFDLACVEFVERWERERDATVEVPAPSGKRKPTVPQPKRSPEWLLTKLGIDPDELADAAAYVDPAVEAMADDILSGRADWLFGEATESDWPPG